jgi:hypothetical protein
MVETGYFIPYNLKQNQRIKVLSHGQPKFEKPSMIKRFGYHQEPDQHRSSQTKSQQSRGDHHQYSVLDEDSFHAS